MKRLLEVVSLLVVVVALAFGASQAALRGWLHDALPAPRVVEPVGVKIYGPAETLVGGEYYFVCELSGEAGDPVWEITPRHVGALTVLPGKLSARFQSNEPGSYVLTVSVAGAAKQVATEHIEFENLVATDEEPAADEPSAGPVTPPTIPPVAPPAVSPDPPLTAVAALVEQALADVPSPDRAAEATRLAGVVRQLINRIETGLVAAEADVSLDLEEQIELALGEKAKAWGLFVAELRAIYGDLKSEGHATTAAAAVPFLETVAVVLARAH